MPIAWTEAEWIKAPKVANDDGEDITLTDDHNPVFKRSFTIEGKVARVTLLASALGTYDLWINGERVGQTLSDGHTVYDELKPGWTDYNKRVQYNCYDITHLCQQGDNQVVAQVAPGWLKGSIARHKYSKLTLAFIAKIDIEYTNGTHQIVATDKSWRSHSASPLLNAYIYTGEIYDARRSLEGEDNSPVSTFNYSGELVPGQSSTVRVLEDRVLEAVNTVVYDGIEDNGQEYGQIRIARQYSGPAPFALSPGETAIIDFGQNCAALPWLDVSGDAGTIVHMRFGEVLNDTGDPERRNDNAAGSLYTANLRNAQARVYYVLSGDPQGEVYTASASYFGYRYCELTATAPVTINGIKALPISSVGQTTGQVVTDNQDVNKLFDNVLWSQLSNFLSIPTDCPQRNERLGWTADAHLFAPIAMYNADMGPFYRKWLGDIRDSQNAEGAYSDVSPLSLEKYGTGGWADAGIIVPWQVYLMTGDRDAVSEHYDSMEAYMAWLSVLREDGLNYPGGYTTYGDCYASDKMDDRFVSQAYYYNDAVLMAKMSRLLGHQDRASHYDELARNIRQEIQSRYFDEQGLITPSQGACVLSLYFGLYANDQQRQSLAQSLANKIRSNGNRLQTGFLSSAYILQTLCDNDMVELAYDLLTQRQLPSWLYMVDNGATTMWETWTCYTQSQGFSKPLSNSFNHIILGAFASWFYSHMAGIAPVEEDPGFNRVVFSPCVDMRAECPSKNKINSAYAHKIVDQGVISAEWRFLDDGTLVYIVNVPDGITGEVRFPVSSPQSQVYINNEEAGSNGRVKPLGYANGRQVFDVQAGTYLFSGSVVDVNLLPTLLPTHLHAWPNPTSDKLHFSVDGQILSVNVLSAAGVVPHATLVDQSTLDVSRLPAGLYLLTVNTDQATYVSKFIKL